MYTQVLPRLITKFTSQYFDFYPQKIKILNKQQNIDKA